MDSQKSHEPKTPPVLEYASPAVNRRRPNPMATASMILALVSVALGVLIPLCLDLSHGIRISICILCSVATLILAVPAAKIADKHQSSGRIRAFIGFWVGIFCLFSYVIGGVFLLPALNSSGPSYRIHCASNLKQIGLAIALYCNDNAGQFPARLDQLMIAADLAPDVFVCSESSDTPAKGATTQQVLTDLAKPGHCSYVYLGAGMTEKTVSADTIIAYENLANHGGQGMNILFGDFHVEWTVQDIKHILSELQAGHNPPRPATQPISRGAQ